MPHCVTKTRLQWAHIRTKDPRRFPAKLEDRVQALLQEQSVRAKILSGSCAHNSPAGWAQAETWRRKAWREQAAHRAAQARAYSGEGHSEEWRFEFSRSEPH